MLNQLNAYKDYLAKLSKSSAYPTELATAITAFMDQQEEKKFLDESTDQEDSAVVNDF